MDYCKIEKDIEACVRNNYISSAVQYPYHNLRHTVEVVQHTAEIGAYYLLSAPELLIVKAAAWFHDIGHLTGDMEGHEERGILIMRDCLAPMQISDTLISSMAACIMATKYPSAPHTLYEEIICDADTFHLGTPKFKETDDLVRKEVELRKGKCFTDWHAQSIQLLEEHRFFTKYCQNLLDAGKLENIRWLKGLPL
jgi:predicted metal-dependent HD superfamily phosphohydrolase